jgi:hypothetical protein
VHKDDLTIVVLTGHLANLICTFAIHQKAKGAFNP